MARRNTVSTRVDADFRRFLDEIRTERVQLGKDKFTKSPARLTLAITRVPKLKDILKEARIDDE
jgi:hypothetical protein